MLLKSINKMKMTKTIYHSKILEKLELKDKQSAGHCGLYIKDFEGALSELKLAINELYKNNQITYHDGIHGKIFKIKK